MKTGLIQLSLVLVSLNCSFQRAIPANEPSDDTPAATTVSEEICLSAEEQELYDLIMAYRRDKNLGAIPLSASLTKVAQLHVQDLEAHPPSGRCNMHSWSSAYGSCCYTDDHRNAECMWNKPRELSRYPGNGYEISHWSSAGADAPSALKGWQGSSGHNSVMINKGIWKDSDWQAVGVGIYGTYAVVWFGEETDPAGKPGKCRE